MLVKERADIEKEMAALKIDGIAMEQEEPVIVQTVKSTEPFTRN